MTTSVAILGATGHLGKALTYWLAEDADLNLTIYARDPARAATWALRHLGHVAASAAIDDFADSRHDAVINCIGIGDPRVLAARGPLAIHELTELFDRSILEWLSRHPESRAVAMSSGAVYGDAFATARADDSTRASFPVNRLGPAHAYGVAKLASEARHRAADDRAIVDVRVFGFFSRFADLEQPYLLNEAVRCIIAGAQMTVGPADDERDYIHPADLAGLVRAILAAEPQNCGVDAVSLSPVGRSQLLDALSARFGLRWGVGEPATSATGNKAHYASTSRAAAERFGWRARLDALAAVTNEVGALLEGRERRPR